MSQEEVLRDGSRLWKGLQYAQHLTEP